MTRRGYQELIAWQKAVDLAEMVCKAARSWPKDESLGLAHQVCRAAVSVPSNVAEGQGRNGTKEFLRFLDIAHGSLCELETQLVVARRMTCLSEATFTTLMDQAAEVGRLLHGLMRGLRQRSNRGSEPVVDHR